MARITVTSNELKETAARLRVAGESVGSELRRAMARVNELASSWTGQAASSFGTFYADFNRNWSQCEAALAGIAGMLDASATAYETAESEVAGSFRG